MGALSKDALAVRVTEKWVASVVVGLDFCPFARRELEGGTIRFHPIAGETVEDCCDVLLNELRGMDRDDSIESTLLILRTGHEDFEDYLTTVGAAETALASSGYEGVYQLASFHPDYCFVDASPDDASNYTNRSPYPMIHILRESSLEKAIAQHPDAEAIPQRNIELARKMGADALKALCDQCWLDDAGNRLDG